MTRILALATLVAVLPAIGRAAGENGGIDYHSAILAFEDQQWKEAGEFFAAAGRKGYDPALVHLGMGRCYMHLGHPSRTVEHLQKALDAGLDSPELREDLAQAFLDLAKPDECWKNLDALEKLDPTRPHLALMRGRILLARSQFEPAYEQLRKVVRDYPAEIDELAKSMPRLQEDALHELVAKASEAASQAATAPSTGPADGTGEASEPQVTGLNHVGGEENPGPPPAPPTTAPEPAKAGGKIHVIKSKNYGTSTMGVGS